MAAPTITRIYPADNDTGIPINAVIEIDFDRGVDEETVRRYTALYGADFDQTSGPDTAMWINQRTGDNPYFLRSPGFTGLVDVDYEFVYLDDDGNEIATPSLASESAETTADYAMRVKLIPKKPLAPDVNYTLQVIGDPDTENVGISSRVVWSTIPGGSNVSTTGLVYIYGCDGFVGSADTLRITITTAGDIGTMKYRWQWDSIGVVASQAGKTSARRYRYLDTEQGVQVRFAGSGFVANDVYTARYEPFERMAASTKVSFVTGDGTYTTAPASPSTPATSSPPTSSIPGTTPTPADEFYVVSMTPGDRNYLVDPATRRIVIEFSEDIDPTTITNDTVTLTVYPALGERGSKRRRELAKKLTVDDNFLIIEF